MSSSEQEIENILKENQELKSIVAKASARIEKLEEEGVTALVIGDAVMDGICIVDDKGIVTSINAGYTKITGIESEQILGRHIQELISKNYFTEAVSMDVIRTREEKFIGKSPGIMRIKELIDYVAPTDATVLIMGETGSGKEVVSREIYEKSKRKDNPYVKINCAAIPENLLESELFGYLKGAFTGAGNKDKKGLFETAQGGTILLDEISEMPLKLQPKLLRVLQEREITPVGGVKSIKIDVRLIAASNKDLQDLVKKKLFRADLYYRLNVLPVNIPPLRERKEDIPDLAAMFLSKFNAKYDKKKVLDSTAIYALIKYDWPGNVREFENIVERLIIISANRILTDKDVGVIINFNEPSEIDMGGMSMGDISLKEAVQKLERHLVGKALREGGSSYAAAKILKTTQPTVVRKAQALGIDKREWRGK